MYCHHTRRGDDEPSRRRVLPHEMNGKLRSIDGPFVANVRRGKVRLRRKSAKFVSPRMFPAKYQENVLPIAAVFEDVDRTFVDDAGIRTESVDLAPFLEYRRECLCQFGVPTDVAGEVEEVLTEFLRQFLCKRTLTWNVECGDLPTLSDQLTCQLLADTRLNRSQF